MVHDLCRVQWNAALGDGHESLIERILKRSCHEVPGHLYATVSHLAAQRKYRLAMRDLARFGCFST